MADYVKEHGVYNIFGIKFAPLRIPVQRRLQTVTVAGFLVTLLFAMFWTLPFFTYLLLCTSYWFVPLLFLTWVWYDWNAPFEGGRKWKAVRNFRIWNYYRDYFPIRLVKTADLSPENNYIFCVYPHGIVCAASFLNFQSNANKFDELYPGIDPYIVILNVNFRIPLAKDLLLFCGAISASERSLLHCLQSKPGASCVIMPGGAGEALRALPGKCNIILKNRRGFVRIALKTGSHLVPVFSFGENEIFDQISSRWLYLLQEKMRRYMGLAPCLIKGRGFFQYSFGLLPHRKPIVTVVGESIPVPKVENPSEELITEYHQKYVEALESLFNEYKGEYHPSGKDACLQIE